jgi:hypothetical protein
MSKRKSNNHIHINGRHYDAVTGEPLDGQPAPKPAAPAVIHHLKPASHNAPMHGTRRHPVNHKHAHAPAPAHTLMRHAVKKPGRQSRLRAQGHVARATLAVRPKASAQRLDELRARHAKHIMRSQLISHFSVGAAYPRPAPEHHPRPASHKPAAPVHHARKRAGLRRAQPMTTADILQKALEHATSFRELPVK